MDKCVNCGKELPPFTYREPRGEGFVCKACAEGKGSSKKPPDDAGKPPAPKPAAKKEEKKKEVPGLSDAIDGLLKE